MINNNHSLYNGFVKDLENLNRSSSQLKSAKADQDQQMALSLINKHKRIFTELLDNMDWLQDEIREWRY